MKVESQTPGIEQFFCDQGYSYSHSTERGIDLTTRINESSPYPRFHLVIFRNNGVFDLSSLDLHIDQRRHRTRSGSGEVRERVVGELEEFKERLGEQNILTSEEAELLGRQINHLLLFGAAETLRRQRNISLTPQDQPLRNVRQARRRRDPRPYKRQGFPKRDWLEEEFFV